MNRKIIMVILILLSLLIISVYASYQLNNNEEIEDEFSFIEWDGELEKVNGSIGSFNVTEYLYIFFNVSEPSEPYFVDEDKPEFLERVDGWTCVDYSIKLNRLNPQWGMVVISDNLRFQGMNHLVNYKITDEGFLFIHDELLMIEYTISGWEYDDGPFDYYHFYIDNEIPTRHYRYLLPNAEEVYRRFSEE